MKKITFKTGTVYGILKAYFSDNTEYTIYVDVVPYADFRERTGVFVSTGLQDKMEFIHGITTTCLVNEFCKAMQNTAGTICEHCYADAIYEPSKEAYTKNAEILNNGILHVAPIVASLYFRFNSHGELISELEYLNYYIIAAVNPDRTFALWTKRPDIVERVHKMLNLKKLKNMTLVLSSPYVNAEIDAEKHPLFDHIFTVYTKEYSGAHGVKITCGARKCNSCGRCYTRRTGKAVAELLKSDARKGKGNGKGKGKKAA